MKIKSIQDFISKFKNYDYIVVLDVLDRSLYLEDKRIKVTFVSKDWLSKQLIFAKHLELLELKKMLEKQLEVAENDDAAVNLIKQVIAEINSKVGD